MAHAVSTPITRQTAVAGPTPTAAPVAVLAGTDNAYAQAKQTVPEKSLYENSAAPLPSRRSWITSAMPS